MLAARLHSNLGEVEKAGDTARAALAAAEDAGDNWAMGWALHVLILVTAMQGQHTDTLPLFDRALAVTQAEPALTDLRLLLQINKAITLGDLDRYEEAFAAAREARHLASLAGTVVRLTQAHSALGQLLFDTGQWAEALAEVQAMDEALKEPGAACMDHGIAAVICFHRGDTDRRAQAPDCRRPYARADRQPRCRPAGAGPQPRPRGRWRRAERAGRADRRLPPGTPKNLMRSRSWSPTPSGSPAKSATSARRKRSPATPKHLPSAPTFRTGRPTRCFAAAC